MLEFKILKTSKNNFYYSDSKIMSKTNILINNSTKSKEERIEIINKSDDNSFNQLLALQLLIQKHSGIKELCKTINFKYIFIIYFSYKGKR